MDWIIHPAWSLVGVGAGVLGIGLAVFFHRRSIRRKGFSYDFQHFQLVSHDVANLADFKFSFKGKRIRQLTASKFLLWNSGNEIIQADDITDIDPLRIDVGADAAFLDVRVTHQTHETNKCSVSIDPTSRNAMKIVFDYLGAGQGALISALISGNIASEPTVCGTLKGYGSPTHQPKKGHRPFILGVLIGLLLSVVPLVFMLIFSLVVALIVYLLSSGLVILGLNSQLGRRFVLSYLLRAYPTRPDMDQSLCERFESDFSSQDFAQQEPERDN